MAALYYVLSVSLWIFSQPCGANWNLLHRADTAVTGTGVFHLVSSTRPNHYPWKSWFGSQNVGLLTYKTNGNDPKRTNSGFQKMGRLFSLMMSSWLVPGSVGLTKLVSTNFDELPEGNAATSDLGTWKAKGGTAINRGEGRGGRASSRRKQIALPAVSFEGVASWTRNRMCTQGGEGNTRFRPYSEPGKTLTQLGQPTQLDQHRDIGMKQLSFHCS